MDDALLMRCGQCVRDLDRQRKELIGLEATGWKPLVETLSLEELHRQQMDLIDLLDRVDGDDIGWLSAAIVWASRRKRSGRSGSAAISAGRILSAISPPSLVSVALSPGASSIEASGGTVLLPVVRIEIDASRRAVLGGRQLMDVAAAVLGFDDRRYPALQLDFDATHSQREFYRDLLTNLRRALGDRFLSVAALPSWCLGDPWLPMGLVDEVVPMVLFDGCRQQARAPSAGGRW